MDNRKCLIVCYSYSGNTWKVAREIQRQTDADLCEIYPRQPYSMQFDTLLNRVREELRTESSPHLLPTAVNAAEYDDIFVGTPNWCGTVAPPIISFLAENSMEGKRLIPFYSYCGSGEGDVEQKMHVMCPGAEIVPGFSVVNDGGERLSEMIADWLRNFR